MPLFSKPGCDWILVGLGNPGREYENTRHNTGFLCIDLLAQKLGVSISRDRFKALTATVTWQEQKLLLLKPQTFMNASGIAVEAAAHFYKVPPERILVIFDDISLPVGRIRVRADGSAGGHNGLKSIISSLGSDRFPRVKIGVGAKPHPDYDLADWVLSCVGGDELPAYKTALEHGRDCALTVLSEGIPAAAAAYNGKA